MYRNPQLKPGLAALATWLIENHYSSHAIGRVQAFVAVNGTLAGAPMLEPADEPEAEEAFTAALPAVALASDAWDRDQSVLFDTEMLVEGHPWPIPAQGDDDRTVPPPGIDPEPYEPTAEDDAAYRAWLADREEAGDREPVLPPIAGGAPEPEPFTPSAEDWRDYHRHFDAVEPRYGYK
jgi:hypothetical protein